MNGVSKRECRGTARDIQYFIQQHFMSVSDALLRAASFAWLSLQMADRPDNMHMAPQKAHRAVMLTLNEELAAWAASR